MTILQAEAVKMYLNEAITVVKTSIKVVLMLALYTNLSGCTKVAEVNATPTPKSQIIVNPVQDLNLQCQVAMFSPDVENQLTIFAMNPKGESATVVADYIPDEGTHGMLVRSFSVMVFQFDNGAASVSVGKPDEITATNTVNGSNYVGSELITLVDTAQIYQDEAIQKCESKIIDAILPNSN